MKAIMHKSGMEAMAIRSQGKSGPNIGMEPTAYTRREQRCLAGVSPFVG